MRRKTFSLSSASIEELQDYLTAYGKDLENKARLLAERLATIGATVAQMNFNRAFYIGNNDVEVTVEETKDGFQINADGEAVCFIEFGTGVGATHPQGTEFGFVPGSWSKDHAQQFTKNGYWVYDGQKIYGTSPSSGMYLAAQDMRSKILAVAKEVFR